ncbi:hypothetical protein ANCDUO_11495 [Ancylostoma duodenale]|uniref:Uncharacterized protein n=1 Tax=Ancylostoma duodenale TaxID=51022 RepID=A0A0C2GMN8_9BILA|nr:hypothetical protein ANCDUO_11495 [Ancylostoma duodenale]
MNITVEGRRPRGRPKTRWLDRIEADMRLLGLNVDECSIEGNGAIARELPTPDAGKRARKKKKIEIVAKRRCRADKTAVRKRAACSNNS